jgi:predicted O-linked N-acetylglucosamine transferase (SPINDLY family)
MAIQWCRDAVDMNPANITALVSVAAALARDADSADDAAGAFVKVLRTHPHLHSPAWALSNRVLSLHYRDDISAATLAREHLRLGRLYEAAHPPRDHRHIDRSLDRPLRIGYVSADFWTHSVMFFLEPILANHDRAQFEIFCYSNGVRADATTARLQSYPLHWRTIAGLPDHHVDDLIARDRIDILVDLTGHTAGSRLAVFAQKPAPIQVSYLGYPSTTGLTRIDYRLSDAVADPPGAESLHSERLMRLETAWCYRPYPAAPPVSPPPALRNCHITFGCFNNLQKLTAQVAGQWAKLMAALPTSRLLVKSAGLAESQSHHLKLLCDSGIPPERIDLLPRTRTIEEHLGTYGSVDIALDTFPYNGTTTTCEALWMGVPVLTIAGDTHHSRVGASLLTTVGLIDWICSVSDFATKAAAAADLPTLAQLRQTLRARLNQSPLLDGVRFTRELETAYRKMWDDFLAQ